MSGVTDREIQWAPSPERDALIRTDLKTTTPTPFSLSLPPSPLTNPDFICFHLELYIHHHVLFVFLIAGGSAPCLLLFLLIPRRYIISHSLISHCCSFRHPFFTPSPPCDHFSCHSLCLINIHPRISGLALVWRTISLCFSFLIP